MSIQNQFGTVSAISTMVSENKETASNIVADKIRIW